MTYQDTGLMFAGEVFMAESTNGVPGAMNGGINIPSLQITPPSSEARNRISKKPDSYGHALDTLNLPSDPAARTMTFDSLPAVLFAECLGGTLEKHEVEAGSVTAETVALVLGKWVKLAYPNVDMTDANKPVVTDTDTTTELVAGTDYEIHERGGFIKALRESAAVEVSVQYQYLAESGSHIYGGTEIDKPRYIEMFCQNLATKKWGRLYIWEARLNANQATDMMQDQYITGQLGGQLRLPPGKKAPYEFIELD